MGKTVVSESVLITANRSPREAAEDVHDAVVGMIERYARAEVALDVASLTIAPAYEQPAWLSITMDGRTKD